MNRAEFGLLAVSNAGKDSVQGGHNSIGKSLPAETPKSKHSAINGGLRGAREVKTLVVPAAGGAEASNTEAPAVKQRRLGVKPGADLAAHAEIESASNVKLSKNDGKELVPADKVGAVLEHHPGRQSSTPLQTGVVATTSSESNTVQVNAATPINLSAASSVPEAPSTPRTQTDVASNAQKLSTEEAALRVLNHQSAPLTELERTGELLSDATYKADKVDRLLKTENAAEGSSTSAVTDDEVENGANALAANTLSNKQATATPTLSIATGNALPAAAPLAPQTTSTAPTQPAVYNAVTDFSAASNQSGTWSYGYRRTDGSFALMPNSDNVYGLEPGLSTLYLPNVGWSLPAIIHNGTGVTKTYDNYVVHPPNMLNLQPGPNGEKSVVRWTAPKAMTVRGEVVWSGLDTRGVTSEVTVNSPNGSMSSTVSRHGNQGNFLTGGRMKAGDVLDFSVSYGSRYNSINDHIADSTGLSIIMTEAYSASGDFSAASNQSGTWSYGYRRTDGSFALMPSNANVHGLPAGMSTWSAPNGGANLPMIVRNGTEGEQTYFTYVFQPGDTINVHPGPNGEKGVVRWTAPSAMTIKIEGDFQGFDTRGATSDVSVVKNSTSTLFSDSVNGYGYGNREPFAIRQDVKAGDVFDFVVGNGGNNSTADSVGLSVLITQLRPAGAHWQFNEGSGDTAVDTTGNGNEGMLSGPSRSIDRDGSGVLNFDGGVVFLNSTGQLRSISNDFTISFWANPLSTHEIDAQSTTGTAGNAGQRYVLWPGSVQSGPSAPREASPAISVGTNGVSLYESDGEFMPAPLVYQAPISGWTHVTVVYENRLPKLYVNGVLTKTGLVGRKNVVRLGPGNLGGTAYNHFHGQLDEVRIFNRAMTATEVQSLLATAPAEPVNAAPSVTITSPSSGMVATTPVNINLSANATDDGAIRKVEFYANDGLIAAKTEQPFNATWGNVAPGTYSITAKATDDAGLTTTSSAVSITVKEGRVVPPPPPGRLIKADVVALDQVIVYNRLGAINPSGMVYALRRDVVPVDPAKGLVPGNAQLRRDKRPRPLVLRMNAGDRLQVNFQNLLSPTPDDDDRPDDDNQPATRTASVHVVGMQPAGSILDDGSNVGRNPSSLVAPGDTATYTFYAEREGNHLMYSTAATTGGEGDGGSLAMGLFGSVNVEPRGAEWYRSQLTAQELTYATTGRTPAGQPVINYDAAYPAGHPRAGQYVLRMLDDSFNIVHGDLNAVITGPNKGRFPAGTYRANDRVPDRDQPFREFTVVYHDEIKAVQAFPQFFEDPVLSHTLHSVRDSFAINYGTGGIGAEILANRLGVGPMADCTECKYEEFFLSAWVVGDPAQVVDVPAGTQVGADGKKIPGARRATKALYPDDPSNVHHSYLNDHVKMRVVHAGPKEHHVHHLHAHQWLRTPDSNDSSYLDSQAMGPGYSFTTEIAHGGSGNLNKTVGDSIFHCHFYPHFAQGMWELWRVHDVFEEGTRLDVDGRPATGARKLPDAEIVAGTPIPALVPIPTLAMPPMPSAGFQGYPFYIPGVAGHRPPKPPLDTVDDGGLARHVVTGGTFEEHHTRLDFNKELLTATAAQIDEGGTASELAAMQFHGTRTHASYTPSGVAADFITNGLPRKDAAATGARKFGAQPGAPFADPCVDAQGNAVGARRVYKGANIQLDLTLNKAGWHFPQSRISVLWDDVKPTINGLRAPEPLFFRAHTQDCIEFFHTNLVPHVYKQDDFQVTTPTDIMGQHIHLVKFDVTASDGSGNGWNYEDGTFSPGEVQERVRAIRRQNGCAGLDRGDARDGTFTCPVAREHPTLGLAGKDADGNGIDDWLGAQTTVQRWYAESPSLRTVFTHDHFGPSTHQQAGFYAGLVIEPAGTKWKHNETGLDLNTRPDGGPTSWQAAIINPATNEGYREFLLEFSDFQLAYRKDGTPVNPPAKKEVPLGTGDWLVEPAPECPGRAPRPCPEAVSADDVGTMSVNYRNEPVALRVRNPQTNTQAAGEAGDLSHVFRSNVQRADPAFNTQPSLYPALTSGLNGGDPFTPMMRAYEHDRVQIQVLVGGFEEGHNFGVHGIKWLFEPDEKNSGYRNNQMMGISEHFEFIVPKLAKNSLTTDYLYQPGVATDDAWNGLWGLMRAYSQARPDLFTLPNNQSGFGPAVSNPGDFNGVCPRGLVPKTFEVSAMSAFDALPGGTLVYNPRTDIGGKLHDPTAILFVRDTDLDPLTGRLKTDTPEPLILRANAGDCIEVTLTNRLPSLPPDLSGYNTLPMIVERFNNNNIAPSGEVGLHPQLLHFNVNKSNGVNVGFNAVQTAKPGSKVTYQWYAGDLSISDTGVGTATPIEFGAINLTSSDPIKHGSKGAVGALIIEPQGATWIEDANSRAQATVRLADGSSFREFVLLFQNDLNLRYGGRTDARGYPEAVRNTAEAEDAEDSGQKAFNYRTEPLWKRMGYEPETPLEETRRLDFTNVLSNSQVGGDPVTPVFTAAPGQAVRMRVLMPAGHARNNVFHLHGHIWEEEPYVNDSKALGSNPLSEWKGAQYGIGPGSHFDLLLKNGAGGRSLVRGDYLFRTLVSFQFDGGLWGIFRVQAAQQRVNVALQSNGGVVSASSQMSPYLPSFLTDGDRVGLNMGVWLDDTYQSWPDWAEVSFVGAKTIDEISVFTRQDSTSPVEPTEQTRFTKYGATAFDVQYWTGSAWATVPGGAVTGNEMAWRRLTFPAVTTTKIRVVVHAGADNSYTRLVEVEAWGASAASAATADAP